MYEELLPAVVTVTGDWCHALVRKVAAAGEEDVLFHEMTFHEFFALDDCLDQLCATTDSLHE